MPHSDQSPIAAMRVPLATIGGGAVLICLKARA